MPRDFKPQHALVCVRRPRFVNVHRFFSSHPPFPPRPSPLRLCRSPREKRGVFRRPLYQLRALTIGFIILHGD